MHRLGGAGEFSPVVTTGNLSLLVENLDDALDYEFKVTSLRAIDSFLSSSAPSFVEAYTFLSFWPGDMDADGEVTANDAVVLTSPACFERATFLSTDGLDVAWRKIPVDAVGQDTQALLCDSDRNGVVDIFDFLAIAANFGRTTGKTGGAAHEANRLVRDQHVMRGYSW